MCLALLACSRLLGTDIWALGLNQCCMSDHWWNQSAMDVLFFIILHRTEPHRNHKLDSSLLYFWAWSQKENKLRWVWTYTLIDETSCNECEPIHSMIHHRILIGWLNALRLTSSPPWVHLLGSAITSSSSLSWECNHMEHSSFSFELWAWWWGSSALYHQHRSYHCACRCIQTVVESMYEHLELA